MTYAIVQYFASSETKKITTSIAVPPVKQPREVTAVNTNTSGELVITYSDGSSQNAGRVVGRDGSGQLPTQSQVSAALIEYCSSGQCDAKQPTPQQILNAIEVYCMGGICRGANGKDATPVSTEQIMNAINNYCADGKCRGADGKSITGPMGETGATGATGAKGEATIISCVVRTVTGTTARFVAWKYPSEPDTAYRDIYKLPSWAECNNPITV